MGFADILKSNTSRYTAASKDDDEVEKSLLAAELQHRSTSSLQHKIRASNSTAHAILSHSITFLVAVLISILIILVSRPSVAATKTNPEPRTKHLHCGNSTTEARALGCVFDVLTNMWVPELCWDREGTEGFMSVAPWQGYDKQDGQRLLTLDEMSERVGKDRLKPDPSSPPYWTPLREHVIHCAFMWQRQHRGFMSGNEKKLDFHSLSYQHTVHCSESLVHMAGAGDVPPDPLDKIAIRTWVGFSECDVDI